MQETIELTTPLTDDVVRSLKAGDRVAITGTIYSARDMAHKRLCAAIESGDDLPFDLKGAVIYYLGPSPPRPGNVIGAAGPTTSSRMDPFTPALLAKGLKATIGKGYRSDEVRSALSQNTAIHLSAIGGAGALLSKHITATEIIAYEDLAAEAVRKLTVKNFPVVVAYDAHSNTVYQPLNTGKI